MKYGIVSIRDNKLTAMLPSEKEVQKLLKTLKKYGLEVKVELLSRCG